jgi:16S rRNA processing protein RimM
VQLEDFWPHKGRMVFKFAGVDSINDAEKLVGCEIQIPIGERAQLEPGAAYIADLVGCEVKATSAIGPPARIGTIANVQFGAGEAPLLVVRDGEKEHLIPFVESFLREMDLERRRITLALPEGMLELDAPLTKEEKKRQQSS